MKGEASERGWNPEEDSMPIPTTIDRVAVTGHSVDHLNRDQRTWSQRALKTVLSKLRDDHGATEVVTRLVPGTDTWAAQTALDLNMALFAVLPFEAMDERYSSGRQELHRRLRSKCQAIEISVTEVTMASDRTQGWYESNESIIEHSDVAVIVSDRRTNGGAYAAVGFALAFERAVILIDPKHRTVSVPTVDELTACFGTFADLEAATVAA